MVSTRKVIAFAASVAALVVFVWRREGRPEVDTTHGIAAPVSATGSAPWDAANGAQPSCDRKAATATKTLPTKRNDRADGHWLRLVNENGLPLPGAEYFEGLEPFASMTGLLETEAWRERWHPDVWLASACKHAIADTDGFVSVHTTDVPFLYVARHEGRLAFWGWPFPEELQFAPDRSCTVTVVDEHGEPIAGAAVVLRGPFDPPNSMQPIVGTTDADGRCRCAHLERLGALRNEFNDRPGFGVRGLGLRSADVAFDPASPPETLKLVLPPCGAIAIELIDSRGVRLASPTPVLLLAGGEQLTEYTRPAGPVEFGLCALGQHVVVATPGGQRVAAPKTAGERVVTTLRLTDLEPGGFVFTGCALTADRKPLANCELHTKTDHYSFAAKTTTTPDGRFVFVYAANAARSLAGEAGLGIVQCESRDGFGFVDRRGTFLQVAERLRPGLIDLGDVVLQDATVLARGRVRSKHGLLPEVTICPDYCGQGVEVVYGPSCQFELRALPNRDCVRLDVRAPGHADRKVVVELPSRDLDIVLEPAGQCDVVAMLEPELARYSATLRAELIDGVGARHRGTGSERSDGWQCLFSVPPGNYRCELHTLVSRTPLVVVPGIFVTAGESRAPVCVDLRGRLRGACLSWVDLAGEEVRLDFASVYAPAPPEEVEGQRVWESVSGAGVGCMLLGTGEDISIVVENGDFTGTYSGPFADAKVVVRPLPAIPFHIPDLPPVLDGDKWRVRAICRKGDGAIQLRWRNQLEGRSNAWTFGDIDANGYGGLRLLPNSRYSIELLFSPGDCSARRFCALDATTGDIELGATRPTNLMFKFDPQQVNAAIR